MKMIKSLLFTRLERNAVLRDMSKRKKVGLSRRSGIYNVAAYE